MNEKFFDLKKEKQDRMINAGLRIFALNGYRHASTDEIVREARISKGLLFHYFVNKSGYYAFLYDYITRYTTLEINSEIRNTAIDYFDLQDQILETESHLMETYPFLFLFLESVRLEEDQEGLDSIEQQSRTVADYYADMLAGTDTASYLRINDISKITEIIRYIKLEVMRETLIDRSNAIPRYRDKIAGYLKILRHLASNL